MTRNLLRVGLGTAALAAVAALSVVLTLAVSRSDGPRTLTQDEVNRQLAAATAAPTPTPTPSATGEPTTDGVEGSVVTDQGTFVGRCVSGQPLLSRWSLSTGYRIADLSSPTNRKNLWVLGPVPWVMLIKGDGVVRALPSGIGVPSALVLQDERNGVGWVAFSCPDGRFNAEWVASLRKPVPVPTRNAPK